MGDDVGDGEIDTDLATAVGLIALGGMSIPEAANAVDVTTWEVEDAIESAGLTETFGLDRDEDVASQIDSLLDDDR